MHNSESIEFSSEDISEYYRLTEVHYRKGWKLDEARALHYGYWDSNTKQLSEALANLNEKLAEFGNVKRNLTILDAGCGVGGSSIYLAKKYGCKLYGISLNKEQISQAIQFSIKEGVANLPLFSVQDFTKTEFKDQSFDIIWAIESVIHADPKIDFFQEAFRLLRPGGKLLIADYFAKELPSSKELKQLMKWLHPWAVSDIIPFGEYKDQLVSLGFKNIQNQDITPNIYKSARKMYWGGMYLGLLTKLYTLYRPGTTRFARNHYKAMMHQFPLLKKGLWNYRMVSAIKK
jgi:cyclopropane fatty-acyl-phospholipid synthase-like methyltransferase